VDAVSISTVGVVWLPEGSDQRSSLAAIICDSRRVDACTCDDFVGITGHRRAEAVELAANPPRSDVEEVDLTLA